MRFGKTTLLCGVAASALIGLSAPALAQNQAQPQAQPGQPAGAIGAPPPANAPGAQAVEGDPSHGLAPTAEPQQAAADTGERPVTAERLANAANEPENWLMVHSTYDSHRYSKLDEIDKESVKNLKPAFAVALGGFVGGGRNAEGGHQATPLVNDGMMYLPDGWGTIYKIDVRDGKHGRIVWVMDPGINRADVWLNSNRGVALHDDKVISVTPIGDVVWTDAKTGELLNSVTIGDPKEGFALTAAPLVIGDKVVVGGSGGDNGARDYIVALNAETGAELWKKYSIPAPGEPGSETWGGDNNAWMHGGGAFWVTGSYDPGTNLTLWGTGQPVPMFDPEYRPGDNLFTNSTLALDVNTGDIKWYFQYTPNDFLDYDEVGTRLLFDAKVEGEDRQLMGYFARNGFYYLHDRTNGQFMGAAQYAEQVNWTDGIDPKTGKPVEYDPSLPVQTYKIGAPSRREQGAVLGCPHIQGGINLFPTSFSERTGLAYGAGIEGCSSVTADPARSDGKVAWNGGAYTDEGRIKGSLTAMKPESAEKVQQKIFDYPFYSGVLTTAGGVVFTATLDGTVHALDDETLEELWTFNVGSFISAPPMTYAVDGKQYVAILVGARGTPRARLKNSPELADMQNTSMLWVFAL